MSTEGTNIGFVMEKNKGAFSISSSLSITPQKPSSDTEIGQFQYIHGALLLPSGIEFSFGNSLEDDDEYTYLGASYYIKDKNYTIGINNRFHYNANLKYDKKPREFGASFSYKISKQAFTPYLKYSLRQYGSGQNLKLLTLGGFTSVSQMIFSFSYTMPMGADQGFYNGKGEIAVNLGVFLN
tara:strand:+ start:2917 stop:3462 length:546 start_codon:yes stop_codon:yes gene_type:complete